MKKIFTALFAIINIFAMGLSGTFADDFGTNGPDTGPFADNSLHNFCFSGTMESFWVNPITSAMDKLATQTVMTVGPQYACNSDADIIFSKVDGTILPNILGQYHCEFWTHLYGVCAGSTIKLNADLLTTTTYRQKTACHEIGHSVGLTHGPSYGGCMISGLSTINYYATHQINHINSYY